MKHFSRRARAATLATTLCAGLGLSVLTAAAGQADVALPLPAVTPGQVVLLDVSNVTPSPIAALPAGLGDVVGLSTFPSSATGLYGANLAVHADGTVTGWGADVAGALDVPGGLTDVVGADLGGGFALALHKDGTVSGWGSNAAGVLDVPADLGPVTAVAALGSSPDCAFGVALQASGTVVQWGGTEDGGCFQPMSYGLPDGLTDVVSISAGSDSAIALHRDGTVTTWGRGATLTRDGVAPSTWTDVTSVSTQSNNFIGVTADHRALTWGIWGESGALQPTDVVQASAGQTAAYLTSDGSAVVYGGSSRTVAGPFQQVEGGLFYALAIAGTAPTATPTASATPTDSASATPTDSPSATPTDSPTAEPTPTDSPTAEPTVTPTAEPTPTETPTVEPTPDPAPLLGSDEVYGQAAPIACGTARAVRQVAAGDGTVTAFHVYIDPRSTATTMSVGVYADSGNEPGKLLTSARELAVEPGWNVVPIPATTVTKGQASWLSVRASGVGTLGVRVDLAGSGTTSSLNVQRRLLTATGMPKVWVAARRFDTGPASIYLD